MFNDIAVSSLLASGKFYHARRRTRGSHVGCSYHDLAGGGEYTTGLYNTINTHWKGVIGFIREIWLRIGGRVTRIWLEALL